MTKYEKVLEWLYAQLPMYQRVGKAAYKADLENTLKLDDYFNHPHERFRSIHIAGTNGKGSVAHMLAAILQSAGYKTALYTSPHLMDFRERIKIDGEMISEKEVVAWIDEHRDFFEEVKPSFFEMTVFMAFDHFARHDVDIAVVETGMGGRLDSTNVLIPELSVITNIARDHTEFLGNTLVDIAKEKAGIIKDGIPVVLGERRPELAEIFIRQAKSINAQLYQAHHYFQVSYSITTSEGRQYFQVRQGKRTILPELYSDLEGIVQRRNLPVVLEAVEVLRREKWTLSTEAVYKGLAQTKKLTGIRGRWEIIQRDPIIVFDTAHNEDGIKSLLRQIEEIKFRLLHIVFGTVADKSIDKVLQVLPRDAKYYFTQANIPRALERKLLAAKAGYYGLSGVIADTVSDAIDMAIASAGKEDLIVLTGSNYVVADAIQKYER